MWLVVSNPLQQRNRLDGCEFVSTDWDLCSGDLGTEPGEVEENLEINFQLANRWGCILLLDEADVFLASRTAIDHLRNSLVSGESRPLPILNPSIRPVRPSAYLNPRIFTVFLRVLEYYAGVLFLTTNRVGDFDEAFASRIHMTLYYPPLDLDSTQAVFRLNLEKINARVTKKHRKLEINHFAVGGFVTSHWQANPKARWNGRQIRNACQTALALAEFEAEGGDHEAVMDPNAVVKLEVKHFKTVADAYLGFMQYMKDIYGIDADERAKEKFLRAGSTPTDRTNPLLTRRQQPDGHQPSAHTATASSFHNHPQYQYGPPPTPSQPGGQFSPALHQPHQYSNLSPSSAHYAPEYSQASPQTTYPEVQSWHNAQEVSRTDSNLQRGLPGPSTHATQATFRTTTAHVSPQAQGLPPAQLDPLSPNSMRGRGSGGAPGPQDWAQYQRPGSERG